jgi:hypothetical protein
MCGRANQGAARARLETTQGKIPALKVHAGEDWRALDGVDIMVPIRTAGSVKSFPQSMA